MRKLKTIFARLGLVVGLSAVTLLTGCATAPKPAPAGQLYHIGLVWLKEPGNAEQRQKIMAAAHAFAREIPEVQFLSVGQSPPSTHALVDDSFDVCVVMQFADRAALERYNRHPVHEEAAREVFLPLSQKILFYDFVSR